MNSSYNPVSPMPTSSGSRMWNRRRPAVAILIVLAGLRGGAQSVYVDRLTLNTGPYTVASVMNSHQVVDHMDELATSLLLIEIREKGTTRVILFVEVFILC